jgi:opacity protein-like surface antigen
MKRILILAILLTLCTCAVTQAAGLWDTTSLSLCYAHSFKGDADGLIGKASVPFTQFKLPVGDTSVKFSVDFLAIPDGAAQTGMTGGFGGSVTFETHVLGINLGVGYLPQNYGFSWNATLIQIPL